MDKARLRRGLLLFFLALLLPSMLLIQQSYSRLKWETFHQYQKMAVELSRRIDRRLTHLIRIEDKRTFADYSYLNTTDNKQAQPLGSPLSQYPIESEIPGVLGYFQVDAQGVLTTPLLPLSTDAYPTKSNTLRQRIAIRNQLQQILAANQLVRDIPSAALVATEPLTQAQDNITLEEAETVLSDDMSMPGLAESDRAMGASIGQAPAVAERKASAAQEPLAFEKLKERSRQIASKNNYARVEDIELKQSFQATKGEEAVPKQAISKTPEIKPSRNAKAAKKQATSGQDLSVDMPRDIRIRTFESEVDPFEFSQLDSGHFVLFRKVWLNGQRYTQGLLIDQVAFLSLIQGEFLNTSLSQMSSVLVAYQGNILTRFSHVNAQVYSIKNQGLIGEALYQARLSDPLSDLQMIYSITDLPIGTGGRLILWLSFVMISVLLGGLYMMYRLGMRQIKLANQQQDFVSAVSHELKTPLTSIRMYGEILKQGWAPEEKKRRYYDFIYDESERLSRLINNVLQLARMNRSEQRPDLAVCHVQALIQAIQSKITSQVTSAHFKLTIEADESVNATSISVDRDWLMQVMINLVDNALKFSAKAERKEIVLQVNVGPKSVHFTVNDFGPGIDKQHMKAIFGLFYRSENELTRDTVGTGIGLSLVHQMVTSMRGKVSVKNRGGDMASQTAFSGAAFTVSFPVVMAGSDLVL